MKLMIMKFSLICCLSLATSSCVKQSLDSEGIKKHWNLEPLENKNLQSHNKSVENISANFDKLSFTKDFVTDINQIKDYPSALVLFTNKWYSKKQARKLCEKVIDLESSKGKIAKDQFKTYFLINDFTGDTDSLNCNSMKYLYNYEKATGLAYNILIPHRDKLNWFQRSYEESKIRGPYVVVYTDETQNPKLIIDLNQLGESSTEYFIQNWPNLIKGIVEEGSLNDPKKFVGKQIISNAKLEELRKKDSDVNKDLWKDGATCIGIVSASVVASVSGGAAATTVIITLSQTTFDAKSKCKSLIDISKS